MTSRSQDDLEVTAFLEELLRELDPEHGKVSGNADEARQWLRDRGIEPPHLPDAVRRMVDMTYADPDELLYGGYNDNS